MFDLIFDVFSAWNQLGLILMGVVFMGIGGGLIAYDLYWRINAVKIKGQVSAVRVVGGGVKKHSDDIISAEEKPLDMVKEFKKEPVATSMGGLFILLFLGIPLVFSGFGIYMGYNYISLTKTGQYADAVVIRNDSSYDSESGTSYKAVLNFNDVNGHKWEVKDSISYGSSPSYSVGTKIGVYYREGDPKDFVIDDFWHSMTLAIIFTFISPVFIGFLMLMFYLNKRQSHVGSTNDNMGNDKISKKQSYSGEMYYSVFEYQLPDGSLVEQVSKMGSNSIIGRIPGKPITLLAMSNNYKKIRRPTLMWLIFGTVFLLPGIFMMYSAFTSFDFNYMIFVIILAALGYVFYKVKGVINKIPKGEVLKAWKELKSKGVKVSSGRGDNDKKGRVLEELEIIDRVKVYAKYARIAGYIMMVIAMGLALGVYITGSDMIGRVQNGVSASGEVVNIRSHYSRSSDSSGYTYYSIVKFIDINGREVRFEDSVGSSHPMHKTGDAVEVLYIPENAEDAIIDRGIFNWGLSGGLALGALLVLWGAIRNFSVSWRFGRTKYRRRV